MSSIFKKFNSLTLTLSFLRRATPGGERGPVVALAVAVDTFDFETILEERVFGEGESQ